MFLITFTIVWRMKVKACALLGKKNFNGSVLFCDNYSWEKNSKEVKPSMYPSCPVGNDFRYTFKSIWRWIRVSLRLQRSYLTKLNTKRAVREATESHRDMAQEVEALYSFIERELGRQGHYSRAMSRHIERERERWREGAAAAHRGGDEGGAGRGGRRAGSWRRRRGSSGACRSRWAAGWYRRPPRSGSVEARARPCASGPRTARAPTLGNRPIPPLPHNHVTNWHYCPPLASRTRNTLYPY